MSKRTTIRDLLVTNLKGINGTGNFTSNVANNVFEKAKFLEDISDYPTICIIGFSEIREHETADLTNGFLNITLRLYVQSTNAQASLDDLTNDVETVIEALNSPDIYDATILRITTDAGLMEPKGIADMEIEISYCVV